MIRVVSKRVNVRRPVGEGVVRVYVGRPSLLGNPYTMSGEKDRERVIELYKDWLLDEMVNGDPAVNRLLSYIQKADAAGKVELECWCAPLRCHADIIKELVIACREKEVAPPWNT